MRIEIGTILRIKSTGEVAKIVDFHETKAGKQTYQLLTKSNDKLLNWQLSTIIKRCEVIK